jgi:hypothetical protein
MQFIDDLDKKKEARDLNFVGRFWNTVINSVGARSGGWFNLFLFWEIGFAPISSTQQHIYPQRGH